MADPGDSRPDGGAGTHGLERGMAIIAELADAFATALASMAEEERLAAGARVAAVAAAARCAARSLERSESAELAGHVDRAAEAIDGIADFVRDRNWRDIAGATAEFARRRPALFGLGALSAGYLVGRLGMLPAQRREPVEASLVDEGGTVDTAAHGDRRQRPSEP